jgi:acyl-CoA-binding protein
MQSGRAVCACPRVASSGTEHRSRGAAFCVAPAVVLPAFNLLEWLDPKRAEAAVERRFKEFAKRIDQEADIPKSTQRLLHGLYKQATEGDASGGPGWFGSKRRYEAWTANAGMSKVGRTRLRMEGTACAPVIGIERRFSLNGLGCRTISSLTGSGRLCSLSLSLPPPPNSADHSNFPRQYTMGSWKQ